MCGFVAIFSPSDPISLDPTQIQESVEALASRGPDSSCIFIHYADDSICTRTISSLDEIHDLRLNKIVALMAFSRLSIRGLSSNYNQPYLNENTVTVFNGEVYNDDSLSTDFKTSYSNSQSDVVIVSEAFKIKKTREAFLRKAEGMYAVISYNFLTREVFAGRDLFGIKPFYYSLNGSKLCCGSSIYALKNLTGIQHSLSESASIRYLLFRQVGQGNTIFTGITSLSPGCIYKFRDNKFLVDAKCDLYDHLIAVPERIPSSREIIEALDKSVELNSTSDVPIACALSGGIDSTYICRTLHEKNYDFSTFSVDVESDSLSEMRYVKKVLDTITPKASYFVSQSGQISSEEIKNCVSSMEEPLAHPNSISISRLCNEVSKKQIKVLLCGEGADEMFFGYQRNYWDYLSIISRGNIDLTSLKYKRIIDYLKPIDESIPKQIRQIIARLIYCPPYLLETIYSKHKVDAVLIQVLEDFAFAYKYLSPQSFLLYVNIKYYLPSLLLRADKMSMAHSVEARVPFLSLDLLSRIKRIHLSTNLKPFSSKGRSKCTKRLLKRSMLDQYGQEFVYRSKQGFTMPVYQFESNEYVQDSLKNSIFSDFMSDLSSNPLRYSNTFVDRVTWPISSLAMAIQEFNK